MPKTKSEFFENDNFFNDLSEENAATEKPENKVESKPVKKPSAVPKTEHRVTSISKGVVFTHYYVNGVRYGANFPLDKEKHKDLKPGDTLYL